MKPVSQNPIFSRSFKERPYRPAVRTPPFHGGDTGSNPVRVASSLASPKDIRTSVRAQCAKHSKPQSIAHSAQPCAAGIIPLGSPVLLASAKELIRLFPQLSPSGSRIRGIYLGSARCIGSNAVRPPVPHSRDQPIHAKRKMWITRSASNNPASPEKSPEGT